MCRHLAYLGPPVTLREVICDPPFGLMRQAWAPRRQRHGTVNADGFGVGWYADGDPDPARYRRAPGGGPLLRPPAPGGPGRAPCSLRPGRPLTAPPGERRPPLRTAAAAGYSATTACLTDGRKLLPGWPRRCLRRGSLPSRRAAIPPWPGHSCYVS